MTYNQLEGVAPNNSTPYPDIRNLEDCKDACSEELMCRGFDVITDAVSDSDVMCWLRFWKEEAIEARDDVDHYARVPCLDIGMVTTVTDGKKWDVPTRRTRKTNKQTNK